MKFGFAAAAAAALFTASAANAITYFGSLTAGSTTATFTIDTDGTLGPLQVSNFTSWSGVIAQGSNSSAIGSALPGAFANQTVTTGLAATATQLLFDPTEAGAAIAFGNNNVAFPFICLTGSGPSCLGETGPTIMIGLDLNVGNFEFVQPSGPYVVASTDVVPEPASWAMLIAGFGLTGAAMRRRRALAVA